MQWPSPPATGRPRAVETPLATLPAFHHQSKAMGLRSEEMLFVG